MTMVQPDSPHAAFLRDIQAWVWTYCPTRQLSATDTYYALKWAASGLPASTFTRAFDAFIAKNPRTFAHGCRLSILSSYAARIMSTAPKLAPQPAIPIPDSARDPFDEAIDRIVQCGKRSQNPLLRDLLRTAYNELSRAHQAAVKECPHWRATPHDFYEFKARALTAIDAQIARICLSAREFLSPAELRDLQKLTPAEQLHCLRLGPDAESRYKNRIFDQKMASRLGFSDVLAMSSR